MAPATLRNQQRILAQEKVILRNQNRLKLILDNQQAILRNQQAIVKNQKRILANQGKILRK